MSAAMVGGQGATVGERRWSVMGLRHRVALIAILAGSLVLNGFHLRWGLPNGNTTWAADAITPLYAYDPVTTELECQGCDARANRETWDDMLRLQAAGIYPAAFAAIEAPVLMLHGDFDPHPGRLIEASLRPHVPQLEYVEWPRCGHYPWIERHARDEFFAVLTGWLRRRGR